MTEDIEKMPFNKIGTESKEELAEAAKIEGITEAEWRAQNLPANKLDFRWRYSDKNIHLYERRLRSLGAFNVGPAVQAWVRSRLEWVRDNKLYELPSGVIALSIDPEGMVEINLEELTAAPVFTQAMFAAGDVPGTLWLAADGALFTAETPKHAADTLVRDLAKTLGWDLAIGQDAPANAEPFAVSDEHGVITCEGCGGDMVSKLVECFDKLWTLNR